MQKENHELDNAVAFVCKNSLKTIERTALIKQIIRCHVSKEFDNMMITKDRLFTINQTCNSIYIQYHARGFV